MKSHKRKAANKIFNSRIKRKGAVGAGTMYIMLILLLVTVGSYLLMGGQLPSEKGATDGQEVIPISNTPEPNKKNLQLYTFGFTTYAPSSVPEASLCTNNSINDEPEILGYPNPSTPMITVNSGGQIKVWVNDENEPIMSPGEKVNPTTGELTPGDRTARAPDGYLWEPALYISPQTAESGGTPHFPNFARGIMQSGKDGTIIKGPAIEPMPPGGRGQELQHHAEYIWDVNKLGLTPGSYAAEFVIWDGDEDRGVGCVTIVIQ